MISTWLIDEYNQRLRIERKRIAKIWATIALVFLVFSIPFAILFNQGEVFLVLFFVFVGSAAFTLLMALLILKLFVSEKPLYQFLYPKIIENLVFNERLSLTYEAYPKNKDFVRDGRIFSPYVSKIIRYKIAVVLRSGRLVDLYDSYLYTQSNNSTVVYLDGFYMVMRSMRSPIFQVRSWGHPLSKETRYKRLQNRFGYKEYVAENSGSAIEDIYYRIYDKLRSDLNSNKVFLSGVNGDLHLAVSVKKMPRKVKTLNQESYDRLKNVLMSVVSTLEEIDRIQ